MSERTVVAVIAARKGSRRLPNKNILPFGDCTLLEHKINQLKASKMVSEVVVSSDSEEMLQIAKNSGVSIHKRSAEYCDEVSKTMGEVVAYVCENVRGTDVLWAPCTAPLVTESHYDKAIEEYYKALDEGYDSLVSVEEFQRFIWDDEGPFNFELGVNQVKSQDLKPMYFDNGGIMIAPRLKMIEWKYMTGKKPYMFKMDKKSSLDINDELDYKCALAWYDCIE